MGPGSLLRPRHRPSRRPHLLAGLICLLVSGCVYDGLDLQGKRCDADRACPADLICVQSPDTLQTRLGLCYRTEEAPACQSGQTRCGPDGAWLEVCAADGHSHTVQTDCLADGLRCNPDSLACELPCEQDADCATDAVCDLGTGLCRPYPSCPDPHCADLCIAGACVPAASADAISDQGSPDLSCFQQQIAPPPNQPQTCELTGRVNLYPSKNNSAQAIGLRVVLRDADAPDQPIQETSVFEGADGAGYYSFAGVATNRAYVIEIEAGTSQSGEEVVSTHNAGVAVRADRCLAGLATVGLSAMRRSDYETFTTQTVDGLNGERCLLIGRALDCDQTSRRPLGMVRVGLAFSPRSPGRVYYFADQEFLFPDLDLEATSVRGYYAVAGLDAGRNTVGFAARLGGSALVLGAVPFTCGPDQVVIADLPLPAESLPD